MQFTSLLNLEALLSAQQTATVTTFTLTDNTKVSLYAYMEILADVSVQKYMGKASMRILLSAFLGGFVNSEPFAHLKVVGYFGIMTCN
jgi:hypothetical protein